MKLASGKEIPDIVLIDTVESIVEEYAGYGFEDWNVAIEDVAEDLEDRGIDKSERCNIADDHMDLSSEDVDDLIDIAVPVASQFASVLRDEFDQLYTTLLGR